VLTQQVEPENRIGRLDAAATPPAETSSVSGATPSLRIFFLGPRNREIYFLKCLFSGKLPFFRPERAVKILIFEVELLGGAPKEQAQAA
jgi:hypothetical protein